MQEKQNKIFIKSSRLLFKQEKPYGKPNHSFQEKEKESDQADGLHLLHELLSGLRTDHHWIFGIVKK